MTPLARRVMEKVRQRDHGTYERWFGAIVDATLDEAATEFEPFGLDPLTAQHAAALVRSLRTSEET